MRALGCKSLHQYILLFTSFKGTGTRDSIWLKVVSLDRSFFKCCFIFFIKVLKSLVVLAKIMAIANVNRIIFVN